MKIAEGRTSGEGMRLACRRWRPRRRFQAVIQKVFGGGAEHRTRGRVRSPGWFAILSKLGTRLGLTGALVCIILWLCLPKPPLLDGIAFSQSVRDRNGQLLDIALTPDQKFRTWTPLSAISPHLVQATLRYEDKYYRQHPGINPIALGRSLYQIALRSHGRTGGSTITMQLARLRFHLQTRTFPGKAMQILRALELERHYSKSEILEAYLNLAPYGGNIEGAGAAAQIYFGKEASKLTGPEAVVLSVIPQSPTRRALRSDRPNDGVMSAQNRWYDRTHVANDAQLSARSFEARANGTRKRFAPHFVREVLESLSPAKGSSAREQSQVRSTLDLEKQRCVETRVADYIERSRPVGIENAAVLLVDTRQMDVLAQVGSADFSNVQIHGQVDGTRSRRSPGSTLKPFLYALAMEQGLIHPLSVIADAPHSFGDYNPENFDREFLGPIRAADALARSRNVPAVALAARLSHPTLYEFLKKSGVALPQEEKFYGLTLPLGGAEVSMEELVQLYGALANDGELRPLRHLTSAPVAPGRRVLSPEACFLTREMLANVPRPELNSLETAGASPVFWKTGTSHGFHDAWSIAIFDHYVLAVWIGNFDGRPNNTFVGRTAAAPLLFQIIDSLRSSWPEPGHPHLPPPGANLKTVEFCAVSGQLPEPWCTQRVTGWFIPGVSPIKTCEIHRQVLVDNATGLRVVRDDGSRPLHDEVFEFWPSDLSALFEKAGLPRRSPPPFLPGVDAHELGQSGKSPRIVGLPEGAGTREIALVSLQSRVVPLRAQTDGDVHDVYWFANRAFLGKAPPNEPVSWTPQEGSYEVTVLDDRGRSGTCKVTVR
jgi:penicillin-binding protein 1C